MMATSAIMLYLAISYGGLKRFQMFYGIKVFCYAAIHSFINRFFERNNFTLFFF